MLEASAVAAALQLPLAPAPPKEPPPPVHTGAENPPEVPPPEKAEREFRTESLRLLSSETAP